MKHSTEAIPKKDEPTEAFASKYKNAIIFLGALMLVSVVLVLLYLALKRELCNCNEKKKQQKDDEEGLYTDNERDEDGESVKEYIPMIEQNSREELFSHSVESHPPDIVIEPAYTESNFKPVKSSNKKDSFFKFKKNNKKSVENYNRVRFAASENSVLIQANGVADDDSIHSHLGVSNGYGSLKRANSMESFVSATSIATNLIEEFGDEVRVGRVQVQIEYEPQTWTLTLGVKQCDGLISKSKEIMYWQVHITLMPFKKSRFKTQYKSTQTPVYNQTFKIENIAAQSLSQLSARYRVYGRQGRAGRKRIAGETDVELTNLIDLKDHTIKDWRLLNHKGRPAVSKKESLV